jgi:hypothetical protein
MGWMPCLFFSKRRTATTFIMERVSIGRNVRTYLLPTWANDDSERANERVTIIAHSQPPVHQGGPRCKKINNASPKRTQHGDE